MEHTEPARAENGPGLCGGDREVFERVWRRVMPVDTHGCPIQLIGEEAAPRSHYDEAGHGPDPWLPEPPVPLPVPQPTPVPLPAPAPPCPSPVCLGPDSAPHGTQLQGFIAIELRQCQRYLALSRRCRGNGARTLAAIAADEKRHAKRLATAYFLISGVEYWPAEQAAHPPTGPLAACLRQQFLGEQQAECAYRAAAESTSDVCLRELYLELAVEENAHAWRLRNLLESM